MSQKILIITSCSASKDDSISILDGSKIIRPSDYLNDKKLISRLQEIRETIFEKPNAEVGDNTTYAFDLYGRAGYTYNDLRKSSNQEKFRLILASSDKINWFFLSGGYGIVNALEPVRKYQATFNRSISYQNDIPYTTDLWEDILPRICDSVISNFTPDWVYVFGSRDYTHFIKQTNFWERKESVKMFESTGSAGVHWLSPKLNNLVDEFQENNLATFNKEFPKFTKQE